MYSDAYLFKKKKNPSTIKRKIKMQNVIFLDNFFSADFQVNLSRHQRKCTEKFIKQNSLKLLMNRLQKFYWKCFACTSDILICFHYNEKFKINFFNVLSQYCISKFSPILCKKNPYTLICAARLLGSLLTYSSFKAQSSIARGTIHY